MIPYISGQNSSKLGGTQIYRYKETVHNGGNTVQNKEGDRLPIQMFEDRKGVLDGSTEMANNLKRESAKIMIFSKIALIEQEIEDLRILGYNCQECFTEHPSQDQRMSKGDVLRIFHGTNKSLDTLIRHAVVFMRTKGCLSQMQW